LSGADLRDTCLHNTVLSGANLVGANLTGVNLEGAVVDDVRWRANDPRATGHPSS
ncbi:MAG: pentapeptide repeat-containing protein, partial [Nostocaceae cyanobacterium]|nr:pentapeptide repeat-containing protein [Nostocaceae cyanobacterium]